MHDRLPTLYKSDSQLNDVLSRIPNKFVEFSRVQKYHHSIISKTIHCSRRFSRQSSFLFSKFPRTFENYSKLTIPRRDSLTTCRKKPWHVSKDKLTNSQIDRCRFLPDFMTKKIPNSYLQLIWIHNIKARIKISKFRKENCLLSTQKSKTFFLSSVNKYRKKKKITNVLHSIRKTNIIPNSANIRELNRSNWSSELIQIITDRCLRNRPWCLVIKWKWISQQRPMITRNRGRDNGDEEGTNASIDHFPNFY